MNILHRDFKQIWDCGFTMNLFIRFLKKHHLVHKLYGKNCVSNDDSIFVLRYLGNKMTKQYYPSSDDARRLYVRSLCRRKVYDEDLMLSQLWKFELLKHLDEYAVIFRSPNKLNNFKNNIKYSLNVNYHKDKFKDNKELMDLYQEFKI